MEKRKVDRIVDTINKKRLFARNGRRPCCLPERLGIRFAISNHFISYFFKINK